MNFSEIIIQLELLKKELHLVKTELSVIKRQNIELRSENTALKDRLIKYENPKNSANSSIALSKDENRPKPNQSLGEPTSRKPGCQFVHKGKTLELSTTPDQIIELQPDYRNNCGSSLVNIRSTKEQSRQIVDIPLIKAVFTAYQSFSKRCNCGCQNIAEFPKAVIIRLLVMHRI